MSLHAIKHETPAFGLTSLVWINSTSCTATHPYGDGGPADHHVCVENIFRRLMNTTPRVYFCECSGCRRTDIKHYFLQTDYGYQCQYCIQGDCPIIPQEFLNG